MSRELPRAWGGPVLTGCFRACPEDFQVEELPAFDPSGEGEHLLLEVEKRGMNTLFAARLLASAAGIPESAVGHAGLKDRHALTRQRFSLHLPRRQLPDLSGLGGDLRVLSAQWHGRKLQRGALAGNRFRLRLTAIGGDREAAAERLRAIAAGGLPNYFGEQRYGRAGDNVESARAMFAGRRVRREQRSLYLSAARSALFDAVLARRVEQGNWRGGLEGEVWMLDGSHSLFGPEPMTPALAARAAALDIHPTGPLWGRGQLRSGAALAELERAVAAAEPALCAGLEAAGLRQERRALRIRVADLAWNWEGDTLCLDFALPPGAYATVLLWELGRFSGGDSD
ncbi:tRNA pseudouridine(13) synthase TruD [Arenimonas fontis]|uniref:tRNA pseudouridine synthase D n=1 Tax=Arenimonas fontis TaxID=2608255 RepID=A0A5B2ZDR4_9GAMM|nr:tRNA pseudouridine(13) synthase TruD [Arenimonas fontis]KAA2285763.1 tRNA pseudouridine(13) synthase TruD [Arenimonas fontis]